MGVMGSDNSQSDLHRTKPSHTPFFLSSVGHAYGIFHMPDGASHSSVLRTPPVHGPLHWPSPNNNTVTQRKGSNPLQRYRAHKVERLVEDGCCSEQFFSPDIHLLFNTFPTLNKLVSCSFFLVIFKYDG